MLVIKTKIEIRQQEMLSNNPATFELEENYRIYQAR